MRTCPQGEAAAGLTLIDRAQVRQCGPDDVLIRVKRTAICGTDLHIWKWDDWAQQTIPVPMIIGHEFSGEIARDRHQSRPARFIVGQRVSGEGHIIDLNSAAARAGHAHLDPGNQGIGVNRDGAFADYHRAAGLQRHSAAARCQSYDVGSMLDPFGNAVHTAQQFDLMGEDVLVTGAGPIGIMAAMAARRAGARSVVLTDRNDWRLELSLQAGGRDAQSTYARKT